MAKIKKISNITIKDNVNNTEFSYNADSEPKKGTVGHSYFGTLSSKGISKLEQKGYPVHNESEWCDLLKRTFGLTSEELGTRGDQWDCPEQREKYSVFIDDVEYNPEYTKGQLKKMAVIETAAQQVEHNIAVPNVAMADISPIPQLPPQVQMPPQIVPTLAPIPQAPAVAKAEPIVLSNIEQQLFTTLKKYVAEGKFTKEQLVGSLTKQISEIRAKELYIMATEETLIPTF